MQTLKRQKKSPWPDDPRPGSPRKRRFSPHMLISMMVTLAIIAGSGVFLFVRNYMGAHAAQVNPNCALIVPKNPLSAQGLATPYQLVAADPNQGVCDEANADQAAFVQGAVLDPATGQISIYNPLVINKGAKPAIAPVVPNLPDNAVVGLWFGFNGDTLTLKSSRNSLQDGKCVNGLRNSIFGQFAACNGPAFFKAANRAVQQGNLAIPQLGLARDGMPCPTTRDFSVVDQDQSDNVTTEYLIDAKGNLAQMTAANAAKLANATLQKNGSDERLLAIALDNALGCTPFTAPNLADPGQMVTALPLNELQAAYQQKAPVALIPAGDPMVLDGDGNQNLEKLNLYRASVGQPAVRSLKQADTTTYCSMLLSVAPARFMLDAPLTRQQPSPDAGAATNLFTFLAQRFNTAWGKDGGINCQGLLNQNSPITLTMDNNGVTTNATINLKNVPAAPTSPAAAATPTAVQDMPQDMPPAAAATPTAVQDMPPATQATPTPAPAMPTVTPAPPAAGAPVSCNVNGTVINNCAGTTTINGQNCQFAFDANTNQIVVTCPGKQ